MKVYLSKGGNGMYHITLDEPAIRKDYRTDQPTGIHIHTYTKQGNMNIPSRIAEELIGYKLKNNSYVVLELSAVNDEPEGTQESSNI